METKNKNKVIKRKWLLAGSLAASLLFLSGCATPNREINVFYSSRLKNKSIQVDFIGVNKNSKTELNKLIDEKTYWSFNHPKESLACATITNIPGEKNNRSISIEDEIWNKWAEEKADDLYILLDSPYQEGESHSIQKLILKMEYYSWYNFWSAKELNLLVTKKGIKVKKS